jgi:hypothetical protein
MFLTPAAKQLLDANNIEALLALTIEELIVNFSENLQNPPTSQLQAMMSAPRPMHDAVMLETLVNPVVVSSGHIYSQSTILNIMQHEQTPRCPNTREILRENCMVPLPQITLAIAKWKLDHAISQLPAAANSLQLSIKVGCNKIRIYLDGNEAPLHVFLEHMFRGKANNISLQTGTAAGYSASDWSFAWLTRSNKAQLEFWFSAGSLQDEHINDMIGATLQPLQLPLIDNAPALATTSITRLRPREYVTAIENLTITQEQAGLCLMAFLRFATSLRDQHAPGAYFEDTVYACNQAPTYNRRELGLGMFAASSTTSATPTSTGHHTSIAGYSTPYSASQFDPFMTQSNRSHR